MMRLRKVPEKKKGSANSLPGGKWFKQRNDIRFTFIKMTGSGVKAERRE